MARKQVDYREQLQQQPENKILRVSVDPGDTLALPGGVNCIRVEHGILWLTERGQDIILENDECYTPAPGMHKTLLSAPAGRAANIKVSITQPDPVGRAQRQLDLLRANRP